MIQSADSDWRDMLASRLRQRDVRIAGLAGVLAIPASWYAAPGWPGVCGAVLAAIVCAIAVIDRRTYRIPDRLTAPALLLGLLHETLIADDGFASAVADAMLRATLTALALWAVLLIYRFLRGRDGLGLGDVKLGAVAGAWLGGVGLLIAFEGAALAALGSTLVFAAWRHRVLRRSSAVPFGLYLAPAIWLAWWLETMIASTAIRQMFE